jgi:hypothetical protein
MLETWARAGSLDTHSGNPTKNPREDDKRRQPLATHASAKCLLNGVHSAKGAVDESSPSGLLIQGWEARSLQRPGPAVRAHPVSSGFDPIGFSRR